MSILRNGLRDLPPIPLFRSIRDLWRYNFGECTRSVEGRGDIVVRELSPKRYLVELSPDAFSGSGGDGSSSDTVINNIVNNQVFITEITNIVNEIVNNYIATHFQSTEVVCSVTCNEDGSLTVGTLHAITNIGGSTCE